MKINNIIYSNPKQAVLPMLIQDYLDTQNEILNSTVRLCGGIYSNTVDIYYFI